MRNRLHTVLFLLFLLAGTPLWAQYDDCALYEEYMKQGDLRLWDNYLHAYTFENLSQKEKLRYLSYEYGYVATAIEKKEPDAKAHLTAFEKHVAQMESVLPKARYLCYTSSAAAYNALYNKMLFMSKGIESYNDVKKAYATDSLDPGVLTLKGNVEFYAPKAIGGNKQKAMQHFLLAKRIYEQKGLTQCNWNYLSTRLCIVQCYEKLGRYDKAIEECQSILKKEPNCVCVRDKMLPELQRKKAEKEAKK